MWLMLGFVLTLFASIFAIYCVYGLVTEFIPTPFHTRKDRMQEVNSIDDIPEFASDEEAAEFWKTHSLSREFYLKAGSIKGVPKPRGPVFRAVIVPDVTGPSFLGLVRWEWQIQEQAKSGGWVTRQSGKQLTHEGARRRARTVLQYVRKGPEIIA